MCGVLLPLTVLGAGCARTVVPLDTPSPQAAAVPDTAPSDSIRPRLAVRPVRLSQAFREAVRRGTRTLDGRPGDAYWQNHVTYRISAELNPASARLTAVATIVLHNGSPDTLRSVLLNLYQNVFATGAQRTRRVPVTGGMRVEHVAADGVTLRLDATPGRNSYRIDGTLMTVDLPFALPPGRAAELEIGWSFLVPPRGAPRTGHDDRDVFVVAQWYPQVATYDDLRGWHDRPYWSNGEFYLETADFDVDLTLPEGWLVGATGTLENAVEVLDPDALGRLADSERSDAVIPVVSVDDLDAGRATMRVMGGQLTWRFRARGVRDFAFATSDAYVWDVARVTLTDGDGPRGVLVHALYRPDAANWSQAAQFLRHALSFHAARFTPYPWPHLTAAEGPIGGMEYPMLVFIGAPSAPEDLYAVLSHEAAHQWWPMQAGNNETDHAWQDEGLATWAEDRSVAERFPDTAPHNATLQRYLTIAGSDAEVPLERPADLYGPGPQYGIATYQKPGTLLRALGAILGEDVLDRAIREYTARWAGRHPSPYDFFHTVEHVAGRDLDWFWSPWWYETVTHDQAVVAVSIEDVSGGGERVTITVEDQGEAPLPAPLALTLESGEVRRLTLPVEPWLEGRTRQQVTVELESRLTRVDIDPTRSLPDVDRRDNVWTRPIR